MLAEVHCRVRYKHAGGALLSRGGAQHGAAVKLVYGGGGFLRFSFTCVNPTHDTKDTVEFLYKRFQQFDENGTRSLDAGEMRLLVQSVFEKHKDQVSYY